MNEEKTLYISDLDGTLLNSNKEVSRFSRETINELIAKGTHFSIATARTAASADWILKGLDIDIPVILMNGAVIYDLGKKEYIKTEVIPEESATAVIAALREHEARGFMYSVSENRLVTYYENLDTAPLLEFYTERVIKYGKTFIKTDNFLCNIKGSDIIYFNLIDSYEPLTEVYKTISRLPDIGMILYTDVYAENQWYLEIFSAKASKRIAAEFLREKYGFRKLIGFGDNFNDIPLFEACDEGYAVANAAEQLKQRATEVIDDNNTDSVARFMAKRERKRGHYGQPNF